MDFDGGTWHIHIKSSWVAALFITAGAVIVVIAIFFCPTKTQSQDKRMETFVIEENVTFSPHRITRQWRGYKTYVDDDKRLALK